MWSIHYERTRLEWSCSLVQHQVDSFEEYVNIMTIKLINSINIYQSTNVDGTVHSSFAQRRKIYADIFFSIDQILWNTSSCKCVRRLALAYLTAPASTTAFRERSEASRYYAHILCSRNRMSD